MIIPWPPFEVYVMAQKCPTCKAAPGDSCHASAKSRTVSKDPWSTQHAARQDKGMRHESRDVGSAPWPEDRVTGTRYDTLGEFWTPKETTP